MVAGGFNRQGTSVYTCYLYKTADNEWNNLPPMPISRACHTLVNMNGVIFVVGGLRDCINRAGKFTKHVICLEPLSFRWKAVKPLPVLLFAHSSVVYNNTMYVFGGKLVDYFPSLKCLAYDPSTDHWSEKADMPKACLHGGSVVLDKTVYVVGGQPESIALAYTPDTDVWTILCSPSHCHYAGPVVLSEESIFVLGGLQKEVGLSQKVDLM